jgi:hypothetical protein
MIALSIIFLYDGDDQNVGMVTFFRSAERPWDHEAPIRYTPIAYGIMTP